MDNFFIKKSPPPVSIITPCYNDGRFLEEAVSSAEACDRSLYEHIIVNDGSTDPLTLEVLGNLEDRGYLVIHQENKGLAASRNVGISQARGRYILPLDSDNKIFPKYLTSGIEILDRNPEVEVVYGDLEYIGEKSGRKFLPKFDLSLLLRGNFIDACAVFRRERWSQIGGYDEKMPFPGIEDWDFWIRISATGGHFVHVPEVLFAYRFRSDSMSSIFASKEVNSQLIEYVRTKTISTNVNTLLLISDWWPTAVSVFRAAPLRFLINLFAAAITPRKTN